MMQVQVGPEWAFARYEAIKHRLPDGGNWPETSSVAENLGEISDQFDAFVFDSFGVLNVGSLTIPGAPERIAALQSQGKQVFVLTNGATTPLAGNQAKYRALGFDLTPSEIVSSREVLARALESTNSDWLWAVAAEAPSRIEELPARTVLLDEGQAWEDADAFILLSSDGWQDTMLERLVHALAERPRPVWVGNPDLLAPFDDGFYEQPGSFAHNLADTLNIEPVFFGKPYKNAFDAVSDRLPPGQDPERVLMVGDTLHTDILGGRNAGFKTALVTAYGVMKSMDVSSCISESGIRPDFVLPSI